MIARAGEAVPSASRRRSSTLRRAARAPPPAAAPDRHTGLLAARVHRHAGRPHPAPGDGAAGRDRRWSCSGIAGRRSSSTSARAAAASRSPWPRRGRRTASTRSTSPPPPCSWRAATPLACIANRGSRSTRATCSSPARPGGDRRPRRQQSALRAPRRSGPTLEPEVRDHEPRIALVPPEGVRALYARLLASAARPLRPGGAVAGRDRGLGPAGDGPGHASGAGLDGVEERAATCRGSRGWSRHGGRRWTDGERSSPDVTASGGPALHW